MLATNFGGAWTNGSLNTPHNNFYSGLTELIGIKARETAALPATAVNFRNDHKMHGSTNSCPCRVRSCIF